jgi:hypothetical protein
VLCKCGAFVESRVRQKFNAVKTRAKNLPFVIWLVRRERECFVHGKLSFTPIRGFGIASSSIIANWKKLACDVCNSSSKACEQLNFARA